MEKGKVSVIVSSFNRPKYLVEAVQSVQRQSYLNLEIIIVDDCSTDPVVESAAIRLMAIDSRARFEALGANCGLRATRQHGVNLSNGEFVQFLDDDDFLHPRKLDIQVASFESDPVLGVVGAQTHHFQNVPGDSNLIWNLFGQEIDLRRRFLSHNHLWGTEAPLWRRSALQEFGGYGWRPEIEFGPEARPFVLEDFEDSSLLLARGIEGKVLRHGLAFHRQPRMGHVSVVPNSIRAKSHLRVFEMLAPVLKSQAEGDPWLHEVMADNFLWTGWLLAKAGCWEQMHRAIDLAAKWNRDDRIVREVDELKKSADGQALNVFEEFFVCVRDVRIGRDDWWRKYKLDHEPLEPLPPRTRVKASS